MNKNKTELNNKIYKFEKPTENDVIDAGVNAVILLREMKKNTEAKNEYLKKYYAENKEKNKDKYKKKSEADVIDKILTKLNNGSYTRTPFAKLKKYNILFNVDTKKFFIK